MEGDPVMTPFDVLTVSEDELSGAHYRELSSWARLYGYDGQDQRKAASLAFLHSLRARLAAPQNSKEWRAVRKGMITCSRMVDVFALSPVYAEDLHRERYARTPRAKNPRRGVADPLTAAKRGHAMEDRARAEYEMQRDVEVRVPGFLVHPYVRRWGASLDGLVGAEGTVEIKCPQEIEDHIANVVAGIPAKHMPQIIGQLAVSGRAWCDFVSFHPDATTPFHVMRLVRDEDAIATTTAAVRTFDGMVEEFGNTPTDPLSAYQGRGAPRMF